MKTIFLTGSKGFIGSHLLPALHEYNVYCGGYNELPPVIPDYIIHLAATTTISDGFNPRLFEDNIVYAKQIMSVPTRIIYASSTSASELSNPYAYTKRYIEHLGANINATGLRFFNVYGNGNNKGIVKTAIDCIRNKETMKICGGGQIRDFIYIDDAVKGIIQALDSTEKIIEIGTGKGTSINTVLNIIQRKIGLFSDREYLQLSYTDMIKSVAEKGIPNCLSFEDGLKKMLA